MFGAVSGPGAGCLLPCPHRQGWTGGLRELWHLGTSGVGETGCTRVSSRLCSSRDPDDAAAPGGGGMSLVGMSLVGMSLSGMSLSW